MDDFRRCRQGVVSPIQISSAVDDRAVEIGRLGCFGNPARLANDGRLRILVAHFQAGTTAR